MISWHPAVYEALAAMEELGYEDEENIGPILQGVFDRGEEYGMVLYDESID